MTKTLKRVFKVAEIVYVIDYWETEYGNRFFGVKAEVLSVNEEDQTFRALLYGDTIQTYRFSDYNHIVFDTIQEANEVARKLPKPKDKVYLFTPKSVKKMTVIDIGGKGYTRGMELNVCLNNRAEISINEIGKKIFLDEEEAKAKLNQKGRNN